MLDSTKKVLLGMSQKLNVKMEEIENEFNKLNEESLKNFKEQQAAEAATIFKLKGSFYNKLRSNAVWFDGFILGIGDKIYYKQMMFDKATKMFQEEPQAAIDLGLVNEQGQPIDQKGKCLGQVIENANYGFGNNFQSYKEKCIRSAYGICRMKNTDELRIFTISFFDNHAHVVDNIPLNALYEFRANIVSKDDNNINLSAVQATSFKPMQVDDNDPLSENNVFTLVSQEDSDFPIHLKPLDDLELFNDEYPNNLSDPKSFINYAMIRGIVSNINLEGGFSNILQLDDLTMDIDLDEDGNIKAPTTVWLNKNVDINFAEGSIAYVTGKTMRRDFTNDDDENVSFVVLNADGVYVPEAYRVDIESNNQANEAAEDYINNTNNNETTSEPEFSSNDNTNIMI